MSHFDWVAGVSNCHILKRANGLYSNGTNLCSKRYNLAYLALRVGCYQCFKYSTSARKPRASEVLTSYLNQEREPAWTSYFVKSSDIVNDQYGMSHFNWPVGESNYHILRVGCYPYIKYHCTKRPWQDLAIEDQFFRIIKVLNLGIPCLMYGVAAIFLIKHKELVATNSGEVYIHFLIPENKGSLN